jgi:hypothetical protein
MDDHTWDVLEDILRQKLPYHRIFTKAGTSKFVTGFEKKKHQVLISLQFVHQFHYQLR